MEETPKKLCKKCGQMKPATREIFVGGKGHRDGLRYLCKECKNKARRKTEPVPEGYKRCSKCKHDFLATTHFFPIRRRAYDGLDNYCYTCKSEIYQEKKSRTLEEGPEKVICKQCTQEKEFTEKFFQKDPTCQYGLRLICKSCSHQAESERRERDPEKYRAKGRNHYYANREQYLQYSKWWSGVNRERRRKREQERRERNPEPFRRNKQRYRQTEHGKIQERAYSRTRKMRLKGLEGTYNAQDVKRQHRRQKGKCHWCGKKLQKYHVDHIIPITRPGSTNWPDNLVLSCAPCNMSRQNKLPHEWPQGGRLL